MQTTIDKLEKIAKERHLNVYWITQIEEGTAHTVSVTPANLCNDIFSISKAFTSTALGMLWDTGKLSLDDTVYDLFSGEYPNISTVWKTVTLQHVLTHTTGITAGFLDVDTDQNIAVTEGTDDYLQIVLEHVPTVTPGTQWVYSDSNYYLISRVVEKLSGIPLEVFLRERLFRPLQFQGVGFAKCPRGHAMGATGLFMSTADLAKFGKLCLDGGTWQGRSLVSQAWLELSTGHQQAIDKNRFYGFGFVGNRGQSFIGSNGMNGQRLFASRKHKTVITWTAHITDDSLQALTDILTEDE